MDLSRPLVFVLHMTTMTLYLAINNRVDRTTHPQCTMPIDLTRAVCCSCLAAVHFHPSSSLLLAAGEDKILRIFDVDGETNAQRMSTSRHLHRVRRTLCSSLSLLLVSFALN